jgi:predicted acyltransferase
MTPLRDTARTPPDVRPTERLMSLDAYRGFIMLAMASGGFALARAAKAHPGNSVWEFLAYQTDHVPWRGCSFWDLIQPSFMFMVGVALPYSYESRRRHGQTQAQLLKHALSRSLILVAFAVFLSSPGGKGTNFVFTNVLAQIGLGYTFLALLATRRPREQLAAAVAILVGYWAWFAWYPLPAADFDYTSVGLDRHWQRLSGFAAHWEKNSNAAALFDRWFLNLFPRPGGKAFVFNDGGYATLNFVPSLATMIFGLLAGEWLRSARTAAAKWRGLVFSGLACLAIGALLDVTCCPSVKRIWTPSWTVFSTGWTLLMLAGFHAVIDIAGWRKWCFPFVVVGMNSIAMYVMAQLMKGFVRDSLRTHLGTFAGKAWHLPLPGRSEPLVVPLGPEILEGPHGATVSSAAVLFVLWLICWAMYRRRIFIKI